MKKYSILVVIALLSFAPALAMKQEAPVQTIAWGLSERQGVRPTMEDTFVYGVLNLGAYASEAHYFGMFDGHGGVQAADFAAQNAITYFKTAYDEKSANAKTIEPDIRLAFDTSYTKLDEEIQKKHPIAGTTALSALILGDELYLAWAGDSRAIVVTQDGTIKAKTIDHKPSSFEEKMRITKTGEKLWMHPLGANEILRIGGLSVSRTLGDKQSKEMVKPGAISAQPQIIKTRVKKGDMIILACDGLWDVMDNEAVVSFVKAYDKSSAAELECQFESSQDVLPRETDTIKEDGNNQQLKVLARVLRNRAYVRRSQDNISVMIIQIQ